MTIIAYVPSPVLDKFWIACSKEEAEKWFIPLLDERGLEWLNNWFRYHKQQNNNDDSRKGYEQLIKEVFGVDGIAYAYFCVSRDLSECYADVAHHPFHQLWNGYSPFCLCDHVEIDSPNQLLNIVMTYKGKPIDSSSDDLPYL